MKKIITYLMVIVMLVATPASVMAQTVAADETTVLILNPTAETVMYEGESLNVKVSLSGTAPYRVAFYLNGTQASTLYTEEAVNNGIEIIGISAGANTIRADALSASGTVLGTGSVTFNVEANGAPVVTVAELDSGEETDFSVTDTLTAEITDGDGNFSESKVFLNGEELGTYAEQSIAIGLSDAASGENILVIEAVDAYGQKGHYEKKFNVKREIENLHVENNFDTYTSGTPTGFTNQVTGKGASYSAVETGDEKYGTSLCLTADAIADSPDVDAHMYVEPGTGKQKFTVKASYYFPGNADGNYDASATLYFRAGNGASRELVDFDKNGKLKWYGTSNGSTTYELNTWYDLELDINRTTGEYDVILNNEKIASATNTHIRDTDISGFRFGICTRTQHNAAHPASDAGAKVYIDNISVTSVIAVPEIESVVADGNDISVTLSSAIDGSDIADIATISEHLLFESEIGPISIKGMQYDSANKKITLTSGAELQPNVDYTVTVKKGTLITSTLRSDCDIRYAFTAPADAVDVKNDKFILGGGKLNFNADIVNNTDTDIEAVAIMYFWRGNELVSVNLEEITATGNTATPVVVTGKPLVKGEHSTVYIFESSALEKAITVKKYCFSE